MRKIEEKQQQQQTNFKKILKLFFNFKKFLKFFLKKGSIFDLVEG